MTRLEMMEMLAGERDSSLFCFFVRNDEKSFITLTTEDAWFNQGERLPGVYTIKLFHLSLRDKLECLSFLSETDFCGYGLELSFCWVYLKGAPLEYANRPYLQILI
jgi:hypothetical protein